MLVFRSFYLPLTKNTLIILRGNDATENLLFEDNQTKQAKKWLQYPDFAKYQETIISEEEATFWKELIDTYLFPLEHDIKQQTKTKEELIELW